jgi:hypothetical protein
MPEESAKVFEQEFSISWPSGYGATLKTVASLGALSPGAPPGYEVVPTLYVIGPDGLIRWSDRRARTRHEDHGPLLKELETEIERALAPAVP